MPVLNSFGSDEHFASYVRDTLDMRAERRVGLDVKFPSESSNLNLNLNVSKNISKLILRRIS
jgi:hypothetical protein